jgi:hypothetical protein
MLTVVIKRKSAKVSLLILTFLFLSSLVLEGSVQGHGDSSGSFASPTSVHSIEVTCLFAPANTPVAIPDFDPPYSIRFTQKAHHIGAARHLVRVDSAS